MWQGGRRPEAIALLDAALRANPEFPEALCMGGYILGESGKSAAALQFYRRAISFKLDLPTAWSNIGKLLFDMGRRAEALDAFEGALALKPGDADLWNSRAGALRQLGRLEESAAAAREALRLRPNFAEAAVNLGNAELKLDRVAEALDAYRLASSIRPDFPTALCGQALALRALDRLEEARAAFERAERLGSVEAISGKGCLDLTLGDFERGWEGYEARWIAGKSLDEALGVRFPKWRGPGRTGERVLVLNDHGLGDTIQFARYLADDGARRRGADVPMPIEDASAAVLARAASGWSKRRPTANRSTRRSRSAACRALSRRASTACRRTFPICAPSRNWRQNGPRASARPASKSASSGRAIPMRKPTWPARCRSKPSRRSPRRPARVSSPCRKGSASNSSPTRRRACGWKRWAKTSTPARTPSSTRRRR